MDIVVKSAKSLAPGELHQMLHELGYPNETGSMRDLVKTIQEEKTNPKIPPLSIMAIDAAGSILSCALLYGGTQDSHLIRPEVHFWTRPEHRRKGLGRLIAAKVSELTNDDYFYSLHDAPEFFAQVKTTP